MKHPSKLTPKTFSSAVQPIVTTEDIATHGAGPEGTADYELLHKHKEESIP